MLSIYQGTETFLGMNRKTSTAPLVGKYMPKKDIGKRTERHCQICHACETKKTPRLVRMRKYMPNHDRDESMKSDSNLSLLWKTERLSTAARDPEQDSIRNEPRRHPRREKTSFASRTKQLNAHLKWIYYRRYSFQQSNLRSK